MGDKAFNYIKEHQGDFLSKNLVTNISKWASDSMTGSSSKVMDFTNQLQNELKNLVNSAKSAAVAIGVLIPKLKNQTVACAKNIVTGFIDNLCTTNIACRVR